jgi:hypothetical protein
MLEETGLPAESRSAGGLLSTSSVYDGTDPWFAGDDVLVSALSASAGTFRPVVSPLSPPTETLPALA